MGVVNHARTPGFYRPQRGLGSGHHQIAANDDIRFTKTDTRRATAGKFQMRKHRAALLGKTCHIESAGIESIEVRRHGQHRADRHHTRAANTGHQYGNAVASARNGRLRQLVQPSLGQQSRRGLAQFAAAYRNEAGAEPLGTAVIFVATVLVDVPLATELRF